MNNRTTRDIYFVSILQGMKTVSVSNQRTSASTAIVSQKNRPMATVTSKVRWPRRLKLPHESLNGDRAAPNSKDQLANHGRISLKRNSGSVEPRRDKRGVRGLISPRDAGIRLRAGMRRRTDRTPLRLKTVEELKRGRPFRFKKMRILKEGFDDQLCQ